MFDVLFSYLRDILTPTRLRQAKMLAWLSLITSELSKIYDKYVLFRKLKLYEINFTGQVMYLQKKLRDTFNCQEIVIDDGLLTLPFYLSNKIENNLPVYAGNNFTIGTNYPVGTWLVFDGFWYEYTGMGDGTVPSSDNSAKKRGKYELYLSNQTEITNQNDFIVKVPQVCYNNMTTDDFHKMRTIIEYYKLVNKQYKIIPY